MTIMNVVFGVGLAASGNGNEFGMLVLPWLASEDVEISATAAAATLPSATP